MDLVDDIYIYGHSLYTHTVAIVVPNKLQLVEQAKKINIFSDYQSLCRLKEIK